MPGAAIQDDPEDARRIGPRHAQPFHRAGRRHQAGGLAVRQECVIGDPGETGSATTHWARTALEAVTVNGAASASSAGSVRCRTMRTSSTADLPGVYSWRFGLHVAASAAGHRAALLECGPIATAVPGERPQHSHPARDAHGPGRRPVGAVGGDGDGDHPVVDDPLDRLDERRRHPTTRAVPAPGAPSRAVRDAAGRPSPANRRRPPDWG